MTEQWYFVSMPEQLIGRLQVSGSYTN